MRAILALLLACALPAAAQTVYKWVDDKGVTHYGEKPPDQGDAARVELKVAPGTPAPPESWKQRELDSRKQKVEQESKARAVDDRVAQEKARRCRTAQAQRDQLRNTRRIYKLDAKGERVYVEDEQRPELMENAEREVRDNCP